MGDAQRFLRYIVPGLIFIIELLAYLLISGDICFNQLMEHSDTLGVAASGLLVSGGLGFIFGAIYYTIVWCEKISKWKYVLTGADLRNYLKIVESKTWLTLCFPDGKHVKVDNLTKRAAWRVAVSYWDTRAETSKTIKAAIQWMDRSSTIMNGLGTTCLASFGALVFFLIYNILSVFPGEFSLRACISFVLGSVILIIHHVNYKGVIKDYENLCGSVLLSEFEREYYHKSIMGSPVKLYVSQNDLKKECLTAKDR